MNDINMNDNFALDKMKAFEEAVDKEMAKLQNDEKEKELAEKKTIILESAFEWGENPEMYETVKVSYNNKYVPDLEAFSKMKSLEIGYNYSGALPVNSIEFVSEITINQCRTWKEISRFPFEDLEKLDIRLEPYEESVVIDAPELKSLKISFEEYVGGVTLSDMNLDLSGCPNLAELIINSPAKIDLSSIGKLEHLETLVLNYFPLEDLRCLGCYPSLKKLVIDSCKLKSLDGIENLPNLEYVDLRRNEIKEYRKCESLKRLKYLNLTSNPITSDPTVKLDYTNAEIIITAYDNLLSKYSNAGFEKACREQYREDKVDINLIPRIQREKYLGSRRQPNYNRIKGRMQESFQESLLNDDIWRNEISPDEAIKLKQELYTICIKKYPFLFIDGVAKRKLDLEMTRFCLAFPQNSMSFMTRYNIFNISVDFWDGDGSIDILENDEYIDRDLAKDFLTRLARKHFYLLDKNIDVRIVKKYNRPVNLLNLVYPILVAILCSEKNLNGQGKMCICDFYPDGYLCAEYVEDKMLDMAVSEGANTIFLRNIQLKTWEERTIGPYKTINFFFVDTIDQLLEEVNFECH